MIVVVLIMSVMVLGVSLFCGSNYDFVNQTGNEIYKLIFQASLSGFVTFFGMFLTIINQNVQQRKLDTKKICPCVIFEQQGVPSAECSYACCDSSSSIDCVGKECGDGSMVRNVRVKMVNIKNDSWAMNCRIVGNRISNTLKYNEDKEINLILLSNPEKGKVVIDFCDAYGRKYKQEIGYYFQNGRYSFISSKPT